MRVNTTSLYNTMYSKNPTIILPFFGARKNDTATLKPEYADLRVFHHHIYEYKKGIRNLILTTEKAKYRDVIEKRLQHEGINYLIHQVDNNKINVYFGEKPCVDVVSTLNPRLNQLSAEQDFILGIMLGYDRVKQCERYLKIKENKIKLNYNN